MKVAILVSGRGSNMVNLIRALNSSGNSSVSVELVLSNRNDAPALVKAEELGVKTVFVSPEQFRGRENFDREVVNVLKDNNIDLICLAGFMRILSPYFVQSFPNKILNIHPSLLPAFPGLDPQKQALDYGAKYSGATVHIVDEGVDSGPIVIQHSVEINATDTVETLSEKILEQEHLIYPIAVKAFAENRIDINGRVLHIKE